MAKHKKKRAHKVSKGLRPNISRADLKLARRDRDPSFAVENKAAAWRAGKRGFVTIPNPNPEETNRRFIKVRLEKYFGGVYKDIKARVKRADDTNKVEIAL